VSGYPEEVPELIPKTIQARARFVKARYVEYKAALVGDGESTMKPERAQPIANELAVGDLLAVLGRLGPHAFRIQFDFEELHQDGCELSETRPRSEAARST
jgi:hypothetical protein